MNTFLERDNWMRAVLDTGELSHLAARVAARIALHLHVESGRCNPGYEHLASLLGISKRSVIRHVAGLESAGWLKVERTGWRHPNNFVLLTPRGDKAVSPHNNPSEVTDGALRGDRPRHSEVTHAVTHKAKRTAKRKKKGETRACAREATPVSFCVEEKKEPARKASTELEVIPPGGYQELREVWQRPHGDNHVDAAQAYERAVAQGVHHAVIMNGALAWVAEREPRYLPDLATWLRNGRWREVPQRQQARGRANSAIEVALEYAYGLRRVAR